MYLNFNKDPRVWKELNVIIEALLQSNNDSSVKGKFSPLVVFETLPTEVQEQILHQASLNALEEKTSREGIIEYVKLTLISINHFPNSINSRCAQMLRHLLKGIWDHKGDKELLNIAVHEVCFKNTQLSHT
uniref:Uncharacterized protein n=1 Tax=Lepeophtheirus salmonis TaxID=72036 RepID=A7TZD0_LEPSM|nr:hypothetical protein [Lepeophtheirus salmonis]